jgi:hypothetical protein
MYYIAIEIFRRITFLCQLCSPISYANVEEERMEIRNYRKEFSVDLLYTELCLQYIDIFY